MAYVLRLIRTIGVFLPAVFTIVGGSALITAGTDQHARLTSYQPFPEGICVLPADPSDPRFYSESPIAIGQEAVRAAANDRPAELDRAPTRFIKDPWPAWSAIAVNPENDMVVMTDENLQRIVEYRRTDNTPPRATMTEPRRIIQGMNTHTEMMCGLYIDPKTLDVYVTNNDTVNWMAVFSREARGNVAPSRLLATPHRSWGLAADEVRQEVFVTIQYPSAVLVYRKTASGSEEPLRILEGDATELADPRGIAVDLKNDLLFVGNHGHRQFYGGSAVPTLTGTWEEWIEETGIPQQVALRFLPRRPLAGEGRFELPSINIYARSAGGNTGPLRVIKGAKTQLNWPGHLAVDEEAGEVFVANDADDSILVFLATDNGDVAPTRVIRGPLTGLKNPTGIAIDLKHKELWVANIGNYAATVYPITANGNVAPLRTIRGGPTRTEALMIGNPGAVGYDTRRREILVPN